MQISAVTCAACVLRRSYKRLVQRVLSSQRLSRIFRLFSALIEGEFILKSISYHFYYFTRQNIQQSISASTLRVRIKILLFLKIAQDLVKIMP